MPKSTKLPQDEAAKQLREKGYRFVHRVSDQYIVLASLPNHRNYMLWQETEEYKPERQVTLRGNAFEFVRPITPERDPTLYFVVAEQDEKRQDRKEQKRQENGEQAGVNG